MELGATPPVVRSFVLAAVMVTALVSGCAVEASAPPPPPPTQAAQLGVPTTVRSASGATATVTLHGVTARPLHGRASAGISSYLVLDVELASTSSTPFSYGQRSFAFQYAGPADHPYEPGNSNIWATEPADYRAFPDYLPEGPLPARRHVRGTVALEGSPHEPLLVEMLDTDDVSKLAEWVLTPT